MKKIEIYNTIAREIVKNYNTYLHPEDVKTIPSINVDKHFTISHLISKNLAKNIEKISSELYELDSSLIMNPVDSFHITLFWSGQNSQLDKRTEDLENIIKDYKFEFEVENLLFGPNGISVKFYPIDESLVEARKRIFDLCDLDYKIDEKSVTTWVSIAMYSKIPKLEVKEKIQKYSDINFGRYRVPDFTLYESDNKCLQSPREIAKFLAN